jgi:hypothetical protein
MGKVLCLGALVLTAGCSFDPSGVPAQPPADASPLVDSAAPADAPPDTVIDASLPDAPIADAGIPDAALPDALLPPCATNPNYVANPLTTRWYRYYDMTRTWTQARDICVADGAHLVVIDDADENAYVRSLSSRILWIGLNDRAVEGRFVWVTGAPVTYTNWQSGEPNDYGLSGEDCVEMYTSGLWNDESCGDSLRFVCECDPEYFP